MNAIILAFVTSASLFLARMSRGTPPFRQIAWALVNGGLLALVPRQLPQEGRRKIFLHGESNKYINTSFKGFS